MTILSTALATAALLLLSASAVPAQTPTAQAELDTLSLRYRDSILPRGASDKDSLAADARKDMDSIRADGSWGDIAYDNLERSAWEAGRHMDRLHILTRAYATPGGALYHDPALKTSTLNALTWWLDHDYQNPNWWWNQIGVPQLIGETALLMKPDLSAAQMSKVDEIMKRSKWTAGQGQNTLWMAGNTIVRGLLENNPAVVANGFSGVYGEIHVAVPPQEGIQVDNSFHQHGAQLYNGGYGLPFGNDGARYIALGWGTRYQIPEDKIGPFVNYLLDGQQWMIRGRIFDYAAVGREITRAGKVAVPGSWTIGPISPAGAAYGILNAADLLAALNVPRRDEFAKFAARLRRAPDATPLNGHKHYWKSDYTVHQRPGYLASVKMFSKRMLNAEVVNSEGRKSHHLSDGAMYLYKTGEEYYDIFPVWDWNRIPGTTAEQIVPMPPASAVQQWGKTAFVGGVSDRRYGVAAMDLLRDTLSARKAWFFFDDEIVALGAGITDTGTSPVLTSINQCWLKGPVLRQGQDTPIEKGQRTLSNAQWVLHDGVGYVFPPNASPVLKNDAQSGRWSDFGTGSSDLKTGDVFSLWLDHGIHPTNASYQYTILPEADAVKLDRYVQLPPLTVCANSPTLQAVRHDRLRMLQAAFWQAGTAHGGHGFNVTVDQPCIVSMRQAGRRLILAVSNPQNEEMRVNLTVDRKLQGPGCEALGASTRITLALPGGDHAGESLVRTLAIQPER